MKYAAPFVLSTSARQCGVICEDGVELMGLASENLFSSSLPSQQVTVYVPGQYDNAYQQRKNHAIAEQMIESGRGFVVTNTRGQDYYGYQRCYSDRANLADYTWVLLGSTFELVAEAARDLDAWLDLGRALAPSSELVLVGHSHGAIKIANYLLANGAQAAVSHVVLLSPSDDIGSKQETLGSRYTEGVLLAKQLIDNGDEISLMPDWASSAPLSARTYYEAYGPESPLTTFAFHQPELSPLSTDSAGWQQPTLVVFGESDVATGALSSYEAAAIAERLLSSASICETFVVAGANHHYRGFEDVVAQRIREWLDATPAKGE